ncbi:MAG: fimbrillin family protein [Parabacteroides sp.]
MRKLVGLSVFLGALSLFACSDDEMPAMKENTKGCFLKDIQLDVFNEPDTKSNFEGLVGANDAVTNPWIQGDKVRLFVTDYENAILGTFNRYEGAIALNRELSYDASLLGWEYSDGRDPVTLSNVKSRLYAFSPSQTVTTSPYYNGDASLNPNAVPIEFNTPNKVDFLFGTHRNTKDGTTDLAGDNQTDTGGSSHEFGTNKDYVDNENVKLRLYMKHAQAYVQVNLLKEAVDPKEKYSGLGIVTKVQIMGLKRTVNAYNKPVVVPDDDPTLPTNGTVNVTNNGAITVTNTAILDMTDFFGDTRNLIDGETSHAARTEFALNPTVDPGTPSWEKGFALVCPTPASKVRGFYIQVDGKDYYVDSCEADGTDIEWKAGYKYTYNLILTGKGINLVPDPDNPDRDGDVDGDGISDYIVVKPWNVVTSINKDF